MKHILNLIPVFIFFIMYKVFNIFSASIGLMISTVLICILIKIIFKKLDKMDCINCISVLFFGFLTLLFHNSMYIKWKITIIYLCLFFACLISYLFSKKPFIQKILEKKIILKDCIWKKLNIIWAIFFLICAGMNWFCMFFLSENMWILFKVFGLTFLTLCFIFINGIYIHYIISKNK
ncbi:MAG: septation protein IspZ [Buchnera aphidicola (Nurudea yanoniella)]